MITICIMINVISINPQHIDHHTVIDLPITSHTHNVYAVEWSGQKVGYIIVNLNRGDYWIEHFYVQESCRNLKIGQTLLNACIRDYNTIYLIVSKTNYKAIHMFKKCNFETTGHFRNYLKMKKTL